MVVAICCVLRKTAKVTSNAASNSIEPLVESNNA
jgi:hypothetical protein